MVSGARLEALVRRLDRSLVGLERTAIAALVRHLRFSERRLEQQIRALYEAALAAGPSESLAFREARARVILAQVRASLDVTAGVSGDVFAQLIRGSYAAGAESALAVLSAYQAGLVAASSFVPIDVAVRAANASARLAHHGVDFAQAAERLIVDGVIQGRGWGRTARELRRETGVTISQAEMIVRTESVTASHQARAERFEQDGIDYGTWMATMDDVVCGYCAARAGHTYRLRDIVIPAHPRCRCTVTPVKKEWVEAGLVDLEWNARHRAETLERMSDRERRGPSPFEKAAGMDAAPTAVW